MAMRQSLVQRLNGCPARYPVNLLVTRRSVHCHVRLVGEVSEKSLLTPVRQSVKSVNLWIAKRTREDGWRRHCKITDVIDATD